MGLTIRWCPEKKLYLCEHGNDLLGWSIYESVAWRMGNRNLKLKMQALAG